MIDKWSVPLGGSILSKYSVVIPLVDVDLIFNSSTFYDVPNVFVTRSLAYLETINTMTMD